MKERGDRFDWQDDFDYLPSNPDASAMPGTTPSDEINLAERVWSPAEQWQADRRLYLGFKAFNQAGRAADLTEQPLIDFMVTVPGKTSFQFLVGTAKWIGRQVQGRYLYRQAGIHARQYEELVNAKQHGYVSNKEDF